MTEKQIADYLRTAACEVFSTMLGMDVQSGEARIEVGSPTVSDGVLSFIGLAGHWTGAGAISCSADFARQICAQLLMTEAPSVNEDVLDAMGEVTNMVIGNLKTSIEEHLGPMGLSIPTVIYGRNFTSRSVGKNEWINVPFTWEGEVIEIRVCLSPSRESDHQRGGFSHASAVMG